MKTLVVYDSTFGNTEQIARAVAGALPGKATVARPGSVAAQDLRGIDLLVVGSPTLGGRATEPMQRFLAHLPAPAAVSMKVAAFDTRITMRFARLFGYAADRMIGELRHRGFTEVTEPQGFTVKGRSGPLADGEIARAALWAKRLAG